MTRTAKGACLALTLGLLVPPVAYSETGEWLLDTRLRIEHVDQDGFDEDADASTLRIRAGYESPEWNGLTATIEGEFVEHIGSENFNSGSNGRGQYPLIIDPDTAEINRAFLYFKRAQHHVFVGRQVLPIKQERFAGTVDHRQNQQTYDALMYMNRTFPGWTLVYGYMDGVRRFLGDDHPLGDIDMNAHVVNAEYATPNETRLTLYGQFFDMQTSAVTGASHRNLGVRLTGNAGSDPVRWLYHVEYADQDRYADGAPFIDSSYLKLEIGALLPNQWTLLAGREQLEGDGVYGFQTPFATGHKYHGRADVFAARTPPNGLVDNYVGVELPIGGARVQLRYHQFDADNGSADYGSEIDATLSWRFRKNFLLAVEYADYSAKDFAADKRVASISLRYQH